MTNEYAATAEYEHLSVALKSFWSPFNELLNEIDSFVPRPLSDFDDERVRWFENTRKLNPHLSDDEIRIDVERRIASSGSAEWQFYTKFSDRIMTLDVTITLLSQALCEAEINAILAVGFHQNGIADQFAKIERADLRKKWLEHPKRFCPKYELNKDSELYKTLDHLIEHRNAWMHHKTHLSVGNKTIIEGSELQRRSFQDRMIWLKRYFSLPYDLADHAHSQTQLLVAVMMFFPRKPIPVADAHK